jgi:hypothetical protein
MRTLNSHMIEWKRLFLPPFCILGNSQLDYRFLSRLLTGYSQPNDSRNDELPHPSEDFLDGALCEFHHRKQDLEM